MVDFVRPKRTLASEGHDDVLRAAFEDLEGSLVGGIGVGDGETDELGGFCFVGGDGVGGFENFFGERAHGRGVEDEAALLTGGNDAGVEDFKLADDDVVVFDRGGFDEVRIEGVVCAGEDRDLVLARGVDGDDRLASGDVGVEHDAGDVDFLGFEGVEEESGGLVFAESADEGDGSSGAGGGDCLVGTFSAEELVDLGGKDAGSGGGEFFDAVDVVDDGAGDHPDSGGHGEDFGWFGVAHARSRSGHTLPKCLTGSKVCRCTHGF